MISLKLMTFNMRTQTTHDGENQFLNRKEFITDKINELKPDIIGCQEIQPVMYDWLVSGLDDYYVVGGGRGVNYDNEAVCVAFRKDRFYLYDCETFWLSPTPNTPGSRYSGDQSSCPRVCTWITVKPKDGEPFRFYNVHTDHQGQIARILAATQVMQKIDENNGKMPMKSFVTGDFNATPEDLCIKTMVADGKWKLKDLTTECGTTFHNYGRLERVCKIDYIFASESVNCTACEKITDRRGDLWLSDHYPIMATVEF